LFELIASRTSAHPMCYFYLSKIYTEIPVLADKDKAKNNLAAFVSFSKRKTKIANTFFQDAYTDLIKLETDHEKIVMYAEDAAKILDSYTSRETLVHAYTRAFNLTKNKEYRDKVVRLGRPEMKVSGSKLTEASFTNKK